MQPMTRILLVMWLALIVQFVSLPVLVVIALAACVIALLTPQSPFMKIVKRTRWLLLMLMLIYGFATPGEYLAEWSLPVAPTYEGLQAGLLQAIRLLAMLAAVAWLLGSTPRADLIAGLHALLMPLRYCGLPAEKFAVRLWLTMHYLESNPPAMRWRGWHAFATFADEVDDATTLELRAMRYGKLDWSLWAGMLAILIWMGLR